MWSTRYRDRRAFLFPDTHAHLDVDAYSDDLGDVLKRARDAGVDRILAVGSDLQSSRRAVELADEHEAVFAAVGVHPHEASRFRDEAEGIRALLSHNKVVAVGEIGLDYYRDLASPEVQMTAFREQLRWARELQLPVSVHNRDADEDVLRELEKCGVEAVLHCFSGTWDVARRALDGGNILSFAGNLTYPRADALRSVASQAPLERVLVESDSPVLAPQAWRGRRNEPAYVRATLERLACLHTVPFAGAAATVTETADALFRWREP